MAQEIEQLQRDLPRPHHEKDMMKKGFMFEHPISSLRKEELI